MWAGGEKDREEEDDAHRHIYNMYICKAKR